MICCPRYATSTWRCVRRMAGSSSCGASRRGGADRSYGIQVARLAGLPSSLIGRAMELLTELEGRHSGGDSGIGLRSEGRAKRRHADQRQLLLFEAPHPVVKTLRSLDPDEMTPREALRILYDLRVEAGESKEVDE